MKKQKSLLSISERMFTPVSLLGKSDRQLRHYWDNQKLSKEDQEFMDWVHSIQKED